jgi:hypothetical protein
MTKMDKPERDRLFRVCGGVSALLEQILPVLLPWSVEESDLEKGFSAAMRKASGKEGRFPQEWIKATAPQLAAGSVLRDPARIRRFLDSGGGKLSPNSLHFLQGVIDRPAFFTSFTVTAPLEDNLHEIEDHAGGERRVLYSTALAQMSGLGAQSHLTLLFDNGSCLQSIGPMHYYRGLEGTDFHYYARLLRPQAYQAKGLSGVMTDMPEWFVVLDIVSGIPPMEHEGARLQSCWSQARAEGFDPAALAPAFDAEQARGIHRLRLKGSTPPLAADLYWDPRKRAVFAHAADVPAYTRLALAAAGQVELPPEPQWRCTRTMEYAAAQILGRDSAVSAWERPFQAPEATPEQKAEMEKVNALMREVSDAVNKGRPISIEEAAARRGVAPETAREVKEYLRRMQRQQQIDVEGGFEDIPFLPPSEVVKMKEPLRETSLVHLSTGSEAERLFAGVAPRVQALRPSGQTSRTGKVLTLLTLPDVLEELAQAEWRDPANHVLTYTLFLLSVKGGSPESTWDYAAEVLKLFWQAVLPDRERMHIRRFCRQYSVWCREFLVRTGLAEEDESDASAAAPAGEASAGAAAGAASGREDPAPGAPFPLRASAFFREWMTLAPAPKGKGR